MRRVAWGLVVLAVVAVLTVGGLMSQVATTYHVRQDGSDSTCNGLADRAASSGNPCAFASVQAGLNAVAVSNCNAGHDLTIHAGQYNGRVTLGVCRPTSSGERTIIEGDPNVPNTSIVLDAAPTDRETFYSSGSSSFASRTTRLTIRHLNIRPGHQAGIFLELQHEDVVIEDNKFDTMPDLCCARDASPFPAALVAFSQSEAVTVRNNVAVGSNNLTLSGIPGTDAQFVWGSGLSALNLSSYVQNNTVTDMLGSLAGGNWTRSFIENNTVTNSACHGDDGGIQGYNSEDMTVRYNTIVGFYCDGDGNGFGDAFVTVRTTCPSDVVGCPPGQPTHHNANAYVYNNTFVGRSTAPRNHRRNAFQLRTDGSPAWYTPTSNQTVFLNNIVMTNNGKNVEFGRIHPVQVQKCATAGILADYNLWYNNALSTAGVPDNLANFSYDAGTCLNGPYNTHSVFGLDPQLDGSFAPTSSGARACAGSTTFVNPVDGDVSKSWMGAKQGLCAGGQPTRPPGSIGRHTMFP